MRLSLVVSAAAFGLLGGSAARACGPVVVECRPPAAALTTSTPEGFRVGAVADLVRLPPALEVSRFTGQPITVVYNGPGRLPGSVDPGLTLVPLPRVAHFHTKAAYPRGY